MTKEHVPALLVVTSIFVIAAGIVDVIIGLVGACAGSAVTIAGAESGSAMLVTLGIVIIVLALIGGILQLIMGFSSVRGKHLSFCAVLAIISAVISAIQLFSAAADAYTDRSFWIGALIALVFTILYLMGIHDARKRGF